jgi:transcriptional regulator with XRE-family HTH domain
MIAAGARPPWRALAAIHAEPQCGGHSTHLQAKEGLKAVANEVSIGDAVQAMSSLSSNSGSKRGVMPSDAFVGKQIKIARLERGMSQTELGEQTGVTFQQIQKYEKGSNRVTIGRLLLIAKVLGQSVDFFFGDYEEVSQSPGRTSSQTFLADPFAQDIVAAYLSLPEDKRQAFRDLIVGIAQFR